MGKQLCAVVSLFYTHLKNEAGVNPISCEWTFKFNFRDSDLEALVGEAVTEEPE